MYIELISADNDFCFFLFKVRRAWEEKGTKSLELLNSLCAAELVNQLVEEARLAGNLI